MRNYIIAIAAVSILTAVVVLAQPNMNGMMSSQTMNDEAREGMMNRNGMMDNVMMNSEMVEEHMSMHKNMHNMMGNKTMDGMMNTTMSEMVENCPMMKKS